MSLSIGSRLGPYEIVALLGAGGMGEVYRARDAKLNRDVAIKVLLAEVAHDADRLTRFKREAQVLASLNHPNIAHVHGFEDASGVHALVMELVEGPTLADRIAQGPLPLDEALPIAKQIAEALEAAHQQGIVHRDLKPANIKVRPDGTVKVLDFGLAKALDVAAGQRPSATTSPTLSLHATQAGVILGTAAYMAPEQARGRVVDARADIWAFGCVLFEMLTGRRAFNADDVTDTMVAVLSKEPEWSQVPSNAAALRPLIVRCLKKDPRQRLQAIGDARIHIEEVMAGAIEAASSTASASLAHTPPVTARLLAGAAAIAAATAVTTWSLSRPDPPARAATARFEIVLPSSLSLALQTPDRNLAISPDGRHIVYRAGALAELVIRSIDRLDGQRLEGTANARYPFFSPDGQWVGFFEGGVLKKRPIGAGPVVSICPSPIPRGASWGEDGNIFFATQDTSTGLLRVPAAGGTPIALTTPDPSKGERDHFHLSLLPGGSGVLFTIAAANETDPPQVAVLDLKTGTVKTLVRGGSQPEYLATGHLVYAVGSTLSAVKFNLADLSVVGDPITVVDEVSANTGGGSAANYAVSRRGHLVYVPADAAAEPRSLTWLDRSGNETALPAPSRSYFVPRLSPDGKRVAVMTRDGQGGVELFNLERHTLTRLVSGPIPDSTNLVWTADGQRLVFALRRQGASTLYAQLADGTGVPQGWASGNLGQRPAWVSPDGTGVLATEVSAKTAGDIIWYPLKAPLGSSAASELSSPPERLIAGPAIEYNPEVSPDGRYIAYQSNESGRDEIYVRPFPKVNDGLWHVTTTGGRRPAWARNGRELFYLDQTYAMTAVPVQTTGATFVAGNAVKLFETAFQESTAPRDYDVAADGRFLIVKQRASADQRPSSLVLVLNWFEELEAKLQGSTVR